MVFPRKEFNKASVKDANMNKGMLADLFNRVEDEQYNIHSMLLLKGGSRVFRASAYGLSDDTKENVYSVSKSFTSVAIGILYDLNLLKLDDYVLYFFENEVKEYLPGYEELKVKHLLTMSVGQEEDVFRGLSHNVNIFETFFKQPLTKKPGEVFLYNNYATFLLSAIVTKLTGKSLNDFLDEYLYCKIGMEKPNWQAAGIFNLGCTGLEISANDMARFGVLLLNDGNWNGEQVVSKEYLDLATSKQIDSENGFQESEHSGYGYQFWMNDFGDYRCVGMAGQYIFINKEHELVFVVKSWEERCLVHLFENYIIPANVKGWKYVDYSLRDFIRKFNANSKELIKKEQEERLG